VIELLDQPAVVIVAAAVASVLLLLEVALPTVGLAGTGGIAAGGLAVWGVERIGDDWWPLLGVVVAVALWGALIAVQRTSPTGHFIATGLYLAGGLGYAATTADAPAAITALVSTAIVAVSFPRLSAAAEKLRGGKPAVGVESYVGEVATVVAWEGRRGQVIVGGTRWNASGPEGLHDGDEVEILEASGLTLTVGSAHG
jgi:membrane-bound ClpP family serine protease